MFGSVFFFDVFQLSDQLIIICLRLFFLFVGNAEPVAYTFAECLGNALFVLHNPNSILPVIMECDFGIDRQHGSSADLVKLVLLIDPSVGVPGVNLHQSAVDHLTGPVADASGSAVAQDSRPLRSPFFQGSRACVGMDGHMEVGFPSDAFGYSLLHRLVWGCDHHIKPAAGESLGAISADLYTHIMLVHAGEAVVRSMGSRSAFGGKIHFRHLSPPPQEGIPPL